MLPNGFTRTALAASLLLGASGLALAQTHPGEATAPAAPPMSSAPTSPTATPAEPRKATQEEHQKGTQAEPNKAMQEEHQKATQAEPNKAMQEEHQKATQAEPQKVEPNRPGATKPSEAAGRGNSAEPGKASANGEGGNRTNLSSNTTVNLTTTQKTEIHNTIINDHSAPRANNLSISLSVGVAVPAAVQFAPLPPRIVEIEPSWRGYDYFLYGEQIVIIEPGTRRIIAILVA